MKPLIQKLFVVSILLLLLILPQEIYSQTKLMRYGIKGGLNWSLTNVSIVGLSTKGRPGVVIGGVFEYWVTPQFAVQANALYNMKGNKWGKEYGSVTFEYTWGFDYLTIPLSAKVAFGDPVKFYMILGPEFSFLLSGTQTYVIDGTTYLDQNKEEDIKDNMKSFEFAVNFGFGVDVPIEPVVLFFELRGSYGVTEVFDKIPTGFVQLGEGTVHHIVPSFTVGVLF